MFIPEFSETRSSLMRQNGGSQTNRPLSSIKVYGQDAQVMILPRYSVILNLSPPV
jgi:hypothetical protein